MKDLLTFGLKWLIAPLALITVALSVIEGVWDTYKNDGYEGEGLSEQFLGETVENIGENASAISKRIGKGLGVYDHEDGIISLDDAVKKGSKFAGDFANHNEANDNNSDECDTNNNPLAWCEPD